jgi:hypothetical protein
VDADFWKAWLEAHEDYEPVAKGLIFAVEKPADAISETKNYARNLSGFEPLDPNSIPAEFNQGGLEIKAA